MKAQTNERELRVRPDPISKWGSDLEFVDTSKNIRKLIRTVIIVISSLYIIYDTYYNFSNDLPKDVVTSTLNYYLDVYNIMSVLFSGEIDNDSSNIAMNVLDEF